VPRVAPRGAVLFLYGIVPTYQPAHFARVYAAYGGVFIALSLAWGWAVERGVPDRVDIVGELIALVGVAVIIYGPAADAVGGIVEMMGVRTPAIAFALGAACLCGLSTPAAKMLVGLTDPSLLAGLLYLGSGLGLMLYQTIYRLSRRDDREAPIPRQDAPWMDAGFSCRRRELSSTTRNVATSDRADPLRSVKAATGRPPCFRASPIDRTGSDRQGCSTHPS
jgi:hypothetical protein